MVGRGIKQLILFFILGLVWLFVFYGPNIRFANNSAKTNGTIIELHWKKRGQSAAVLYETHSGRYRDTISTSFFSGFYEIGETVEIQYLKDNPSSARFVGFWSNWGSTILVLFGILLPLLASAISDLFNVKPKRGSSFFTGLSLMCLGIVVAVVCMDFVRSTTHFSKNSIETKATTIAQHNERCSKKVKKQFSKKHKTVYYDCVSCTLEYFDEKGTLRTFRTEPVKNGGCIIGGQRYIYYYRFNSADARLENSMRSNIWWVVLLGLLAIALLYGGTRGVRGGITGRDMIEGPRIR